MILLLLACSPYADLVDRWNTTWAACDPDTVASDPDPYDLDATLSATCQDRLLDDLHADRDTLDAWPTTDTSPPLAACVATSAYALLTRDAGQYPTTPAGQGVYPVYLDELQEVVWQLGGDSNRQLAYNYTAHFTAALTLDDALPDGALAQRQDDDLHLAPAIADECGVELAHVLFHEAGHAVLEGHVACPEDLECPACEAPPTACDADDQGTFAMESSLLALWGAACGEEEEEVCGYLDAAQGVVEGLITPPN